MALHHAASVKWTRKNARARAADPRPDECWVGNDQMVKLLLAHGVNPTLQDKFGEIPLREVAHFRDGACERSRALGKFPVLDGYAGLVAPLSDERPDARAEDEGVATPLHGSGAFAHHLSSIIGPWKLAGVAAVLAPSFPGLEPSAQAGVSSNYCGARPSHVSVGKGPVEWIPALVSAAFNLGSWALRPPDRRCQLLQPSAEARSRPRAWVSAPALLLVVLVTSYFTMPEGPLPWY